MTEATETVVDGRYRIVDRIGSGGMADVYLARDTHLAREVALKVLHRRFARDAQFVERFRREASSAAALQHPHVVNVFDRGEHDGTYYIAMEHLRGRTLKEVISEEAPLSQERAIDLGVQILLAAGFAHGRGVVHRDFKPHNVIVDENDEVKVTDFGIARAGASEITETGSILGTAQYLSPEQAQGGAVDPTSDIYSIGVILYELLAGRLPFEGDSAVAIAVKHVSEDPPRLAQFRPDIHPALEAAVMRALAKDPRQRFRGAEEFVSALQAARARIAMGDQGQGTAVWGPLPPETDEAEAAEGDRRRRRWWWLLVPLLIAGAAAFLLLRGPAQVEVPDVLGETLQDAQPELEQAGFEVAVERRTDPAPINDVIEQEPPPGTEADEGSTVTLVASSGPGQAKVPDVVGLLQAEAIDKLDQRGFRANIDREFSTDVEQDRVIRTVPEAGIERPRGSAIQVIVSSGPRQVQVPSVIGESSDTAAAILEAQGLGAAIERVESSEPSGEVIDQDPGAGARVDEGTEVALTVSTGPAPEPEEEATATVPSVVGQSEEQARARLEAAGFSVSVQEQTTRDPGEDGVVLRQSPAGGRQLEEGATVTIVVGRFEEPRQPPDDTPPDGTPPDDAEGTPGTSGRFTARAGPPGGARGRSRDA